MNDKANSAAGGTPPDPQPASPVRRRIVELDLLRGFFVIVIILDHLQMWPSPLYLLSGKGLLWGSAAEGFFLVSGFLIGYIRAYKGRTKPLRELTVVLLRRALKLYLWGIGISLAIIGFTLLVGGDGRLPKLPTEDQLATPFALLRHLVTMDAFNDWIYFLRLYAVMLAVTPIFLWFVRRRLAWLAALLSVAVYALSFLQEIPDAELQWQLYFFGAALMGYRFEDVRAWLRGRAGLKTGFGWTLVVLLVTTTSLSGLTVHAPGFWDRIGLWDFYQWFQPATADFFSNNPTMPGRVALAFLWFAGFLALFHILRTPLEKYLGWLLLPFGTMSLTAYCLQALVMPLLVLVFVPHGVVVNTIQGLLSIGIIWFLLGRRSVQRLLPQ
ncbi:OpgC domain-containing protein [Brevibacterium sp. 91QC2O2]|uniref:OpgC domain-containing protein n=1 Tax=Brevibacterium sp. 91QC2O2 TaxID=2968458 RepID=UPI00211C7FF2|nr:OpgC domain-containing protein [Brevibacterium sp. 91QC2O2]MCQ9368996.1 OpgC domain-containing protein [Brevibacterium sp. 91QC2O2]